MLSHPRKARTRLGQIADGGLFMFALGAAYGLRANAVAFDLPELRGIETYLWLFPCIAIMGPWMLSSQGFYTQPRLTSRWGTMMKIVRAGMFTVLATILMSFLIRADVARSVVILVGAFGGFLVYIRHELSVWSSGDERWQRRVMWVGTATENAAAQTALSASERDAIMNVDECDPATTTPGDFEARMRNQSVDAVIASMRGADTNSIQALLGVAEREGVELLVRPGVPLQSGWRLAVDDFGGEPVLYVRAQEASPIALSVKQALDYLLAAILGIVLSPLILLIILAVKFTSRGPVLFHQSPRRQKRTRILRAQISYHARRRGGGKSTTRRPKRDEGTGLQDEARPAGDGVRTHPSPPQFGRAAPTLERFARRNESRGSPPSARFRGAGNFRRRRLTAS
jgi:hypothetical protein